MNDTDTDFLKGDKYYGENKNNKGKGIGSTNGVASTLNRAES